MTYRKVNFPVAGAMAGAALGVTQLPRQGYDFSQSAEIYQAIGFLRGFAAFGAIIGWFSARRRQ